MRPTAIRAVRSAGADPFHMDQPTPRGAERDPTRAARSGATQASRSDAPKHREAVRPKVRKAGRPGREAAQAIGTRSRVPVLHALPIPARRHQPIHHPMADRSDPASPLIDASTRLPDDPAIPPMLPFPSGRTPSPSGPPFPSRQHSPETGTSESQTHHQPHFRVVAHERARASESTNFFTAPIRLRHRRDTRAAPTHANTPSTPVRTPSSPQAQHPSTSERRERIGENYQRAQASAAQNFWADPSIEKPARQAPIRSGR